MSSDWMGVALAQIEQMHLIPTLMRLVLAVLFGGVIGMERGRRHRPAGMRTHMLVCVGSALVMITGEFLHEQGMDLDPTRMGAQVISGIGFLGVGTIIVDRQQQVRGLTTAAGLWASACMGLAIGVGFYSGAAVACILIFLIITIINKLEHRIMCVSRSMDIYVELDNLECANQFLTNLAKNRIKVVYFEVVRPRSGGKGSGECVAATLLLRLPKRNLHSEMIGLFHESEGLQLIEEI